MNEMMKNQIMYGSYPSLNNVVDHTANFFVHEIEVGRGDDSDENDCPNWIAIKEKVRGRC